MERKTPFLYTEDVMSIFSCCSKTARKYIKKANERIGLPDERFISIKGFCKAYKVDVKRVIAILDGKARQLSKEQAQ